MWFVELYEILQKPGTYRLAARSEDHDEVHGLCSHDHESKEDAMLCPTAVANVDNYQ